MATLDEVRAKYGLRTLSPQFEDGDSSLGANDAEERVVGYDAPEIDHPEQGLAAEPGARLSTDLSNQFAAQPGAERRYLGQRDVYGRNLVSWQNGETTLAEEQLRRGLGFVMDSDPRNVNAFRQGLAERQNPSTPEQAKINAVLDAEWASARPNYQNRSQVKKRGLGEVFSDAIDRGLDSIGLMVGGTQKLIGEMVGSESLTAAGNERIRQNRIDLSYNQADIGTMDNVKNVSDGLTYVVEKLGEQGPNLLATVGAALATGGTGALAGASARMLAAETVASRTAAAALGGVGKVLTRELGAAAAAGTLNIGESKIGLDEVDPNGEHNVLALATGVLKSGLDLVSLANMPGVGQIILPMAKRMGLSPKDALKAWGDIPMAVARQAVMEGSTEGLQGLLDEAAQNYQAGKPIDWANVRESAAVGALTGGAFSVPTAMAEVGIRKVMAGDGTAPPGGTTDEEMGNEVDRLSNREAFITRRELLNQIADLQQVPEEARTDVQIATLRDAIATVERINRRFAADDAPGAQFPEGAEPAPLSEEEAFQIDLARNPDNALEPSTDEYFGRSQTDDITLGELLAQDRARFGAPQEPEYGGMPPGGPMSDEELASLEGGDAPLQGRENRGKRKVELYDVESINAHETDHETLAATPDAVLAKKIEGKRQKLAGLRRGRRTEGRERVAQAVESEIAAMEGELARRTGGAGFAGVSDPNQLVTIYRGETSESTPDGEWWTTNPQKAAKYGRVSSVQLPAGVIGRHAAQGHNGPDELVFSGKRPTELAMRDRSQSGGPTTPEPQADIDAQAAAAADPADSKPAVWVADGGVREAKRLQAQGLTVISLSDNKGERGLLASRDVTLLEAARARVRAGESITDVNADVLGIPASKAAAVADPNAVVIQNRNEDGAVVREAVASRGEAPAAAAALARQGQPGERQVVISPEEAQARRAARTPPLPKWLRDKPRGTGPVFPRRPNLRTPAGPVTKRKTLSESYDDIIDAIHIRGGMSVEELSAASGLDPADLKSFRRPGYTPFRVNKTPKTRDLDEMREYLTESGYLPEGSVLDDMYQAIERAIRGERVLSANADMDWFTQQEREHDAWVEAQRAAEDEAAANTPAPLMSGRIAPRPGVKIDAGGYVADAPTYTERAEAQYEPAKQGELDVGDPNDPDLQYQPGEAVNAPANGTTMVPVQQPAAPEIPPPTALKQGQATPDPKKRVDLAEPLTLNDVDQRFRKLFARYANKRSALLGYIFRNPKQYHIPGASSNPFNALHERIKRSKYARDFLFAKDGKKTNPVTKVGDNKKARLSDWNTVALNNAADSVRAHLASLLGYGKVIRDIDVYDSEKAPLLLHTMERAAEHLTDSQLDSLLEALHNDKQYKINRVGRADGANQDNGTGLAQRGPQMDPDGRVPAQEEYAGEDTSMWYDEKDDTVVLPFREYTARKQAVVEAIANLGITLKPIIKRDEDGNVIERTSVADQVDMLLDNPSLANVSPERIASFVANSLPARGAQTLAQSIKRADKLHTDAFEGRQVKGREAQKAADDLLVEAEQRAMSAGRRKAHEAGGPAGRAWEADNPGEAMPRRTDDRELAEDKQMLEQALDDMSSTSESLQPGKEQHQFDRENEAERRRRGATSEPYFNQMSVRDQRRVRRDIANPVPLAKLEDELAADTPSPAESYVGSPLVSRMFGEIEKLAKAVEGLRNQEGAADGAAFATALLNNGKPQRVMRELLRVLTPFLRGVRVELAPMSAQDGGMYDPATRVITINSAMQSEEIVHVFLHEALHAATYAGLRNNTLFNTRITRMREAAKREAAGKDVDAEITKGLVDNDEFVAQLFSSPTFLEFLGQIEVSRKSKVSVLQGVLRAIADMLGLSRNTSLGAAAIEDVLAELAKGPQDVVPEGTQGALFSNRIKALAEQPAKFARKAGSKVKQTLKPVLDAQGRQKLRAATDLTKKGGSAFGQWALDAGESLLSSDWQMRRNLIRAGLSETTANRLADMWYRRPGMPGGPGLMQRAGEQHRLFRARWIDMVKKHGEDAILAAWNELEQENRRRATWLKRREEARQNGTAAVEPFRRLDLSPAAVDLVQFFKGVALYVDKKGVKGFNPIDPQMYYLPQIYDKGEVKARQDEFISALVGMEYQDAATGEIRRHTRDSATLMAASLLEEHKKGVNGDIPWAGSLRARHLTDPAAAAKLRELGFMNGRVSDVVDFYTASVTKQAEFEETFGDWVTFTQIDPLTGAVSTQDSFPASAGLVRSTLRGLYGLNFSDQDAKRNIPSFRRAIERGIRDGAFERQADGSLKVWQRDWKLRQEFATKSAQANQRVQKIIAGYMGNLGTDMNPTWRHTQQWIMAAQAITTLAFSAISSLPEAGIVISGAPDAKSAIEGLKRFAKNPKEAFRILHDFGYVAEHSVNLAMADTSQQVDLRGAPREIVDKFFRLNGQHFFTQLNRAMATQMFISALEAHTNEGNTAWIESLGLTTDQVQEWFADGKPAFAPAASADGTPAANAWEAHPVTRALQKFVDERVVMPSSPQLPVFFNDPRFGLVTQLKRFFYAYGGSVVMRLARVTAAEYRAKVAAGDHKGAAALQATFPFLIMGVFALPLAVIAGELKDWMKYEAWGEEPPKWREKEGFAFWWDTLRRSGLLGPADLAVTLFDDTSGGVEALMGPAFAHLDVALENGFFSEEMLRRSTPVLGQLPGFWQWMEE